MIIAVLLKPLRSRIEAGVGRIIDWLVEGDGARIAPGERRTPSSPRRQSSRDGRYPGLALPDLPRAKAGGRSTATSCSQSA